jgi:hypothetical protein
MEIAVFRKIPRSGARSSQDMHVDVGQTIQVPTRSGDIPASTNVDGALREIEKWFGIGEVHGETLDDRRQAGRISLRHLMPFILQDDDVIVNKSYLLRGTNDHERRQAVIDSIPYFLSTVDETTYRKELELRSLRRQLERMEAEFAQRRALGSNLYSKGREIYQQALSLGLCDPPVQAGNLSDGYIHNALAQALQQEPTTIPDAEGNELGTLYEELGAQRKVVRRLKGQIQRVQDYAMDAERFGQNVSWEAGRLAAREVFRSIEYPEACPFCGHTIDHLTGMGEALSRASLKMAESLKSTEGQKPHLESHLAKLKADLASAEDCAKAVEGQIAAIVATHDKMAETTDWRLQQSKVIGRISLYLESGIETSKEDGEAALNPLRARILELEAETDTTAKSEAIASAENYIGSIATRILDHLPFEARYRGNPVYINFRNLTVGVSQPRGIEHMRDVGSDENYLSLHIALMLALHRYFAEVGSPVPGLVVIDQISRPYYPKEEENEIEVEDADRKDLLTYFDFLFDEVEEQESFQTIILEHAYFRSNARYRAAVLRRWKKGQTGLIPEGWPMKS